MSDLPDSIDFDTMALVIAWDMTKTVVLSKNTFRNSSIDGRINIISDAFNKAHQLILQNAEKKTGVGFA